MTKEKSIWNDTFKLEITDDVPRSGGTIWDKSHKEMYIEGSYRKVVRTILNELYQGYRTISIYDSDGNFLKNFMF